jgi:uncharacterized membrane protein
MILDYLKVFLLSASPIIELRGGIPLGIILGIPPLRTFLLAVFANMIIVVPWLLLLQRLEDVFAHNKYTRSVYSSMVRRAEKARPRFVKYGKYALFLFVAIPIPSTGAYTACVASRLFRIPLKDTFWVIFLGVITAGILVLLKTLFWVDVASL